MSASVASVGLSAKPRGRRSSGGLGTRSRSKSTDKAASPIDILSPIKTTRIDPVASGSASVDSTLQSPKPRRVTASKAKAASENDKENCNASSPAKKSATTGRSLVSRVSTLGSLSPNVKADAQASKGKTTTTAKCSVVQRRVRCSITNKMISLTLSDVQTAKSLAPLAGSSGDDREECTKEDESATETMMPLSRSLSGLSITFRQPMGHDESTPSSANSTPMVTPRTPITTRATVEDAMLFLQITAEKLKAMLPDDVLDDSKNAVVDDSVTPGSHNYSIMSDVDEENSTLKINVDLYRKLFAAHQLFVAESDAKGKLLAFRVVDMLLKLRIKRVHNSLVKTYFDKVVEILDIRYGGRIAAQVSLRKPIKTPLPLPSIITETAAHIARVECLVDIIVAPCDDATYSGVLQHLLGQRQKLAEMYEHHRITDVIVKSINAEQGMAELETLWLMLLDGVKFMLAYSTSPERVARAIESNRIPGLVCRALSNKWRSPKVQMLASHLLLAMCADEDCRQFILRVSEAFSEIWDYLLPALANPMTTVAVEVKASLQMIFAQQQTDVLERRLLPDILASRPHLIANCGQAPSQQALEFAMYLVSVPADIEGYFQFHTEVLQSTIKNVLQGPCMRKEMVIAGMQYVNELFSRTDLPTAERHMLVTIVHNKGVVHILKEHLVNVSKGRKGLHAASQFRGGVLYGVGAKVLSTVCAAIATC